MDRISDDKLAEMLAGCEGISQAPWVVAAGVSHMRQPRVVQHVLRCAPDTIRALVTELQALRASQAGMAGGTG